MCKTVEEYAKKYAIITIVKNMIAKGIPDEKIAEYTELSLDEIKAVHIE